MRVPRIWQNRNSIRKGVLLFFALVVFFSVSTHSTVDKYGLVQVVLHPVVLIGLCLMVKEIVKFCRWQSMVLWGLWAFDFFLGIALNLLIQSSYMLDHKDSFSFAIGRNFLVKTKHELVFLGDFCSSTIVWFLFISAIIIGSTVILRWKPKGLE
jgi:hypothetical protein